MKSACLFLAVLLSSAVILPAASANWKPQSVVHKHVKPHKVAKHRAIKHG